ncbi:MAG: HAMP domain-containing histidine kinase [Planctomycetes bacterium]|nr:HAMP domain-containing histidine kinase [Planctomycetota bacterium]
MEPRRRWNLLSLLPWLGMAATGLVLFQLWRGIDLERGVRELEVERSRTVAERLLRQAGDSPAVFLRVRAAARFDVVSREPVIDAGIGWLDPVPASHRIDVVVQDRLDRAARAEFGTGGVAAVEQEYAALLAGTLLPCDRVHALAAAAWHGKRAGAATAGPWTKDLHAAIADLTGADFARHDVQAAALSALRLQSDTTWPSWLEPAAGWLHEESVASLPPLWRTGQRGSELQQRAAAAALRRQHLRAARGWLPRLPAAAGVFALPTAGECLWWLPGRDGDPDRAAVLPVAEFVRIVHAAAFAGDLPTWPWLLAPEPTWSWPANVTEPTPVPGLLSLPLAADSVTSAPPLLAAVTIALVLAFVALLLLQFRAARREAEAARRQSEFLTTVTHELKTPLASIRLLAEMLAEGRARGREVDYYAMLAGETGRLAMLIENVLDLGRTERGERPLDLRVVDLREVVADSVALFAPLAARDGLVVQMAAVDEPMPVTIDRGPFAQALRNVLDNAQKYAAAGGRLDITHARTNATTTLTVRDFGPGVPADERERIFGRFVRGERHQSGAIPGVGIGLHLARLLVQRHGGTLVCQAPADGGAGAEFVFTLPDKS